LTSFLPDGIRIDVATLRNPTGAEYDLFGLNAFVIRCEIPVGVRILRPQPSQAVSINEKARKSERWLRMRHRSYYQQFTRSAKRSIPSANTAATVYAIAERAAELIGG
jgi:hypothetical protein